MKIHDNGFTPQAGETYWAAALPYGTTRPTILPVCFMGEAPYLELKSPGVYHSEWWLLKRCEVPTAEVVKEAGEIVVRLVNREPVAV